MTRRNRRPGFTLIEVLLVMAIILIMAAVAFPTLSAMWGDVRAKAAADQVRAAWTEARARAIEDNRAYRFAVEPGTPEALAQLASWFEAGMKSPEVQPKLAQQGLFPALKCGAAFGAFMKNLTDDYTRVVKEAGIKVGN